jgi:hypothetical protein
MDPIFSAGVFLAMYSGRLAARVVEKALAAGNDGARDLKKYEKRVFKGMHYYLEMVEGFYTQPFMELFVQPRDRVQLEDAIVAILAGELEGGWKIEWRRWLFFTLVKIQARRRLVPAISFEENGASHSAIERSLNVISSSR